MLPGIGLFACATKDRSFFDPCVVPVCRFDVVPDSRSFQHPDDIAHQHLRAHLRLVLRSLARAGDAQRRDSPDAITKINGGCRHFRFFGNALSGSRFRMCAARNNRRQSRCHCELCPRYRHVLPAMKPKPPRKIQSIQPADSRRILLRPQTFLIKLSCTKILLVHGHFDDSASRFAARFPRP